MIKIFKVTDYDWYAARTAEEAISQAIAEGHEREDIIDPPRELSRAELNETDYIDLDKMKRLRSFGEELIIRINNKDKFPCLFAVSEC